MIEKWEWFLKQKIRRKKKKVIVIALLLYLNTSIVWKLTSIKSSLFIDRWWIFCNQEENKYLQVYDYITIITFAESRL